MSDQPHGNLHLLEEPEFKDLVSRKNRFSLQLTIITLVVYYGFILLVAFKRGLFSAKVFGDIPFGIILGIAVIIAWMRGRKPAPDGTTSRPAASDPASPGAPPAPDPATPAR